jgi:predicted ATP-dependent endonuclease of OLD family
MELKPFTLIIGENNSGKTNLLTALSLIFSQDITAFRNRVLEQDDINYKSIQAFKAKVVSGGDVVFPAVKIEATLADMTEEQEAVCGDWFIDKELTKAKLTYVFHPRTGFKQDDWLSSQRDKIQSFATTEEKTKQIDFPIKKYEYTILGGDDPTNRCDPYFLKMLKMEMLDALRDAKKELVASGEYRLLFRILNRKEETEYSEIKEHLLALDKKVKDNPVLNNIKAEIAGLLDIISLQEDKSVVDFSFSTPETSDILKKLGLRYGEDPIGIERNGLGRNNLLYISLLLSHFSSKPDDSDYIAFRLLGVEEPEAHLHPHLQDHLAENIRELAKGKRDLQVLMTSHSAHIASSSDFRDTAILYNEGGKINNHFILKGFDEINAENKKSIHYLRKFLDATKSTMFFARKLILVEGISEQILIPKFFELYTGNSDTLLTLEKIGCNIVNVTGVPFKHFLRVIQNGYFIKCLVLTDRDSSKKDEGNRAENLKKDYESNVIYVSMTTQTTFEEDIIEANNNDKAGRKYLLLALERTRPNKVKLFKKQIGNGDSNIESFFEMIKLFKSEFTLNLLDVLDEQCDGFIIPEYIKDGFNFLIKYDGNKKS